MVCAVGLIAWRRPRPPAVAHARLSLQQTLLCEHKVQKAIDEFFRTVAQGSYGKLQKDSLFADQEEFLQLQLVAEQEYSLVIEDWWLGVDAAALTRFSNGARFGLLVRPERGEPWILFGSV